MEKNVWNRMQTVHLPKAPRGEEAYVYVSVNERSFQVPRGQEVQVPLPVAARLTILEAAREKADAFMQALAREGQ